MLQMQSQWSHFSRLPSEAEPLEQPTARSQGGAQGWPSSSCEHVRSVSACSCAKPKSHPQAAALRTDSCRFSVSGTRRARDGPTSTSWTRTLGCSTFKEEHKGSRHRHGDEGHVETRTKTRPCGDKDKHMLLYTRGCQGVSRGWKRPWGIYHPLEPGPGLQNRERRDALVLNHQEFSNLLQQPSATDTKREQHWETH